MAFLRSPVARATITALDVADAAEAAGVVAVFTGADVAHLGDLPVNPLVSTLHAPPFPVLADGRVDAVGQAVAAVVATSEAQALDALELIELDFDSHDPVLNGKQYDMLFDPGAGQLCRWRDLAVRQRGGGIWQSGRGGDGGGPAPAAGAHAA